MKAWLLTSYVVLFIILILAFIFAIIAFSRSSSLSKSSTVTSAYPGTNVYVSGVAAAPKSVFINSDTISNPETIYIRPQDNGTTFYVTGSTAKGINFDVVNNSEIPNGYYVNVVSSVVGQNIIIGTNIAGAQQYATIIPTFKAFVCKNVAIVNEASAEPTLFNGVIQLP